jgi:homogentisate 1,2-dioxygenase
MFFLINLICSLRLRGGLFMDIPYVRGVVAQQAHVAIPDGTYEEEIGRNGFFGKYAHLYRRNSPVDWTRIEGDLRPRAYDFRELPETKLGVEHRRVVLKNNDVQIGFTRLTESMPYCFRNADGDELFFVHKGAGRLETDYGPLRYESGDYLVIPRGTLYRFLPTMPSFMLALESVSEFNFPDRGMLGQHALFDPAVVRVPTPELTESESGKEYEVRIKRLGQITKVFYPFHPIDAIGWKGTLTVQQLNVRDIRPVLSDRYHLPPSAHTTFVAHNFVVCTFAPRPLETGDDQAMRVPFYHSNIDFDEVLFYHDGEFFSRSGIDAGMLTFHPQGIHHGPHKKAVERSQAADRTNETAIMIDTKNPLFITDEALDFEMKDYWKSWQNSEVK